MLIFVEHLGWGLFLAAASIMFSMFALLILILAFVFMLFSLTRIRSLPELALYADFEVSGQDLDFALPEAVYINLKDG